MAKGTLGHRGSVLLSNSTMDFSIAAIASLRRSGWKVEGTDIRQLPLNIRSRHLKVQHLLCGADAETYRLALSELLDDRRPDVFLPIGYAATLAACSLTRDGEMITHCNVPPLESFQAAHDKSVCAETCRSLGIPVPLEFTYPEAVDLLRTGQCLVVKPARSPGAARGLHYVSDEGALTAACESVTQEFGAVQIQEYIPGGASSMHSLVVLFSAQSQLTAAFTLQKIRQWPKSGGISVIACSTAESGLIELMLPLFQHWNWHGPAEVELKLDSRDGRFKVIEINPRFPGYLRMPISCGLDLPGMAARLALGTEAVEAVEFPGYACGRRYINPGVYVRSFAAEFRAPHRRETIMNAASELKGCGSNLVSILSDPLPAIARAALDARASIRRSRQT